MNSNLAELKQAVLVNALRSCQLFTGLASENLQAIAAVTVTKSIEKGGCLFHQELAYDPCPLIKEGAMVEVMHGPLRGVVGRLVRKDNEKARLVLSVDLIGQAVSVEVDAGDVRPY